MVVEFLGGDRAGALDEGGDDLAPALVGQADDRHLRARSSCSDRQLSISTGETFSPPVMIMSSTRPVTNRSPSASKKPVSPVKYQPSRSALASASGRFQ